MNIPGKINLFFRVLGKREDGYHDIETVFWPLEKLCDTVEITRSSSMPPGAIRLRCDVPGVPLDEHNLCWKAIRIFQENTGRGATDALELRLDKRIPVCAGLGGGSADAAAALLEMRRLYQPEMSLEQLGTMAVRLGADVPFFLMGKPASATGIGEQLRMVPSQGRPRLLLVNPGFPIPAKWAYAHWFRPADANPGAVSALLQAMRQGQWELVAELAYNDLEHAVFRKFPLLQLLRQWLEAHGIRHVHVSGSGPTLFGFSEAEDASGLASEVFEKFGPGIRVFSL